MRVGIVGLGYVGLPLAVAFAEAGHDVYGVDVDVHVAERLDSGDSHVGDISSGRLGALLDRFSATTRFEVLADADAVILCVPTPLTRNREPDLTALLSAAHAVAANLRSGQLVCLESTTWPGTTRERLVPVLEESGLHAGEDFCVAYSPERVDPGRTDYDMRTTPKVVGGLTPACLDRAAEVYGCVCDEVVPVTSPEAAELTKLLENIFRTVNIALVNELAMLADRMDIDIWEVVDAAATKPFGFMSFTPGPGMGGHCLPVDPFYLSWKAREYDFPTEFIELAGKVNAAMPDFCVSKIVRALNDHSTALRGAKVLVIGVSYKAGVGDLRESPAIKIVERLLLAGAEVHYHDPHVARIPEFGLEHEPLEPALGEADIAVIVTAHPEVDHRAIAERAPAIVDLRGAIRELGAGVGQSTADGARR